MLGRSIVVLGTAVLLAAALPARAQITTGSISGTVKDGQGGVVPGAMVRLINEAQLTQSAPVVTDGNGDFLFVNVNAGIYTIDVSMPAFKTLKQSGVSVSPGTRTSVGALTIEVGGTSETVTVRGQTPEIQATTGDRSFTIDPEEVANLPIESRSFTSLAFLAPGVDTGTDPARLGGGSTNIMMDGVSTMDTGSNRILLQMNVESIAQVKVMVSSYQAEYGRSNGLQITAVTKSGSNGFRGSVYDVERNSDWNHNSHTNFANNDPKVLSKQRDWGYSIGGPIGKPGRSNKLFFFYSQGVRAAHDRKQRAAVSISDGVGAKRRFLGDDGQQRQRVSIHPRSAAQRDVQRDESDGVFCRRRRDRPDPSESALPDRHQHSQPVADAEPLDRTGPALQF
jgi:hypothetical protein